MDFIFFAAELSGGTLAVDVGAHDVAGAIDPHALSSPPPTKFQLDLIDPQNPGPQPPPSK